MRKPGAKTRRMKFAFELEVMVNWKKFPRVDDNVTYKKSGREVA